MDTIMQHFRKDEQAFIENAMDWVREVENSYAPKLTDYLNPRERFIVESLTGGTDVLTSAYGAYKNAERMRMLLYPTYYTPEPEDYGVTILEVNYPSKFVVIEHKDMLGSLMSLGIDRSKFGDIHLQDDQVQFAVVSELKDYMFANLIAIGKAKVTLQEVVDEAQYLESEDVWIEALNIVSSMRLDAVIASILSISRQKAVSLIRGDKVRVNWTSQNDPSLELYEADILSIRGSGRFKVITVEGRTKKDKVRLLTGKLE